MEAEKYSIPGLYYKYKKTTDEEIREYLKNIILCKVEDKGIGSIHGYYPLNDESMNKIMEKPRNISLTFDAAETKNEPLTGLIPYKIIVFLVKSTSRFFLKPDVGEIFDQVNWHDLMDSGFIKAICLNSGYETLEDTDGEHFLMTATLLISEENKQEAINELHKL